MQLVRDAVRTQSLVPTASQKQSKKSNLCFLVRAESFLKWRSREKRKQISHSDLMLMVVKALGELGKDPTISFSVSITESTPGPRESPILVCPVMWLDCHSEKEDGC